MRSLCVFFSRSKTVHIWLGGLFTPEAYITATRQYVAQVNNWSLEELYLDVSDCTALTISCRVICIPLFAVQVHVDSKGQLNDCSFGVTGMFVC